MAHQNSPSSVPDQTFAPHAFSVSNSGKDSGSLCNVCGKDQANVAHGSVPGSMNDTKKPNNVKMVGTGKMLPEQAATLVTNSRDSKTLILKNAPAPPAGFVLNRGSVLDLTHAAITRPTTSTPPVSKAARTDTHRDAVKENLAAALAKGKSNHAADGTPDYPKAQGSTGGKDGGVGPATADDNELRTKHLNESINYNQSHADDHMAAVDDAKKLLAEAMEAKSNGDFAKAAVLSSRGMTLLSAAKTLAESQMSESTANLLKGIDFGNRPHKFVASQGGRCLFCSNTQSWHATHKPLTPDERDAQQRAKVQQQKNNDAYSRQRMLTALPTDDEQLTAAQQDQKRQQTAADLAALNPDDPKRVAKMAAIIAKAGFAGDGKQKPGGDVPQGEGPQSNGAAPGASRRATPVYVDTGTRTSTSADRNSGQKPSSNSGKPGTGPGRGKPGQARKPYYDNTTPRGGMTDLERSQAAEEGRALSDGTMPIDNDKDLSDAITHWGSHPNPDLARRHIVSRAGTLNLTHMLPEDMKAEAKDAGTRQQTGSAAKNPYAKSEEVDPTPLHYAITKATDHSGSDSHRYTLGPVYLPNSLDAHGEFTTADTLQKALWDYAKSGDRSIRLQHNTNVKAGEWVELISWPQEISSPLILPTGATGSLTKATFPPGTAYMGIIWEPWAWSLVTKGKLRGLSMGGTARRVAADFDE